MDDTLVTTTAHSNNQRQYPPQEGAYVVKKKDGGRSSLTTTTTITTTTTEMPLQQQPPTTTITTNTSKSKAWIVVVGIYQFMTVLCIFMVIWIVVLPASIWMEHSTYHVQFIHTSLSRDDSIATSELFTKYRGERSVQLLHILPGAVWAILVPIQLHSQIRKDYREAHKVAGYIFAVVSILMSLGVVRIFQRQLQYENYYPDLPPLSAGTSVPGLLLLTLYFAVCVLRSIYSAAILHDYHGHRKWMIRHIASGIWISLQRILLITLGTIRRTYTRQEQRSLFGLVGTMAIVITISMGEYAVYLLNDPQAEKQCQERATKKTA